MSEEKKEVKKVKSIRGIDEKLYEQIALIARETGRTVGEVINEAMKVFVNITSKTVELGKGFVEGVKEGAEPVIKVAGVGELTVTEKDLREVEGRVDFANIQVLKFEGVPYELFEEKVRSVTNVREVIIPKEYPKLKVLRKFVSVDKVVTE